LPAGESVVKVIVQMYPVLPAASEEERIRLRPIGRNSGLYQKTLRGWNEIVEAADDLGLWGVTAIEHHFHSEGYEVSPNPGVMNAYWAAKTKNLHIGQLGYVMSAHNPLRVAEETAILDHLTQGRCFVGFSRGFQSRWTDLMGQHIGTRATLSDGSDDDRLNREIFEEAVDIVLRAWTEESIEHNSPRWQIPYPYEGGHRGWFMAPWTAKLGAHGEIGPQGEIRRISVVPAPYTKPHPRVFVASNASRETVEYAGRHGFIPAYFSKASQVADFGPDYVMAAAAAGHRFALGQNQAIVRMPRIADTMAQARAEVAAFDGMIFKHFYENFLPAAFREKANVLPDTPLEDLVDPLIATGLVVAGTASEVRDAFVAQWRHLPAEYIILIYHYAQQPKDSVIANLEAFMREVKPALDELTEYRTPSRTAG
jgi:alkanesulfonate monooxygenase SsuD/methylene tetrahydromethanopterin reductase-like flavin-dependent oxidoreductase (luciferase family)